MLGVTPTYKTSCEESTRFNHTLMVPGDARRSRSLTRHERVRKVSYDGLVPTVHLNHREMSRTPSPEVRERMSEQHLSPISKTPPFSFNSLVAGCFQYVCQPLQESEASMTSQVSITNLDRNTGTAQLLPIGLEIKSFMDCSDVVRHVVRSVYNPIGAGSESVARQFGFRKDDELLMVGEEDVVDKRQSEVIHAFRQLYTRKPIKLVYRRQISEGNREIPEHEYIEVTGNIDVVKIDQEEPVCVVSESFSLGTTQVSASGLYMVSLKSRHQAYIAGSDNATYLKATQGSLEMSESGLTDSEEFVFDVCLYTGFTGDGRAVSFFIISHQDQGRTFYCKAISSQQVALQEAAAGSSPPDDPEADVSFKCGRLGHLYFLESLKHKGNFIKWDENTICLREGSVVQDRNFQFYVRHDEGCIHCKPVVNELSSISRSSAPNVNSNRGDFTDLRPQPCRRFEKSVPEFLQLIPDATKSFTLAVDAFNSLTFETESQEPCDMKNAVTKLRSLGFLKEERRSSNQPTRRHGHSTEKNRHKMRRYRSHDPDHVTTVFAF